MGQHQTKKLCTTKEIINKFKRQHFEWEKLFTHRNFNKQFNIQNT